MLHNKGHHRGTQKDGAEWQGFAGCWTAQQVIETQLWLSTCPAVPCKAGTALQQHTPRCSTFSIRRQCRRDVMHRGICLCAAAGEPQCSVNRCYLLAVQGCQRSSRPKCSDRPGAGRAAATLSASSGGARPAAALQRHTHVAAPAADAAAQVSGAGWAPPLAAD